LVHDQPATADLRFEDATDLFAFRCLPAICSVSFKRRIKYLKVNTATEQKDEKSRKKIENHRSAIETARREEW
jgi:hypothetical protein